MALVLVGAMIVAGIDTVWAEDVTPAKRTIATTDYTGNEAIELAAGAEMGRFKLGSTVIVLFPKGKVQWDAAYLAESVTVMGQKLGTVVEAGLCVRLPYRICRCCDGFERHR